MLKFLSVLALLLLVATFGCGEPTVPPEEAYAPEELAGTVDTSLPAEVQEKQKALWDVLEALREGVDVDSLGEFRDDVRFTESLESFLEGGINLASWDFGGKPTGDDVPVVLFFALDTTGEKERRAERVYTVTRSAGRWTISRKP